MGDKPKKALVNLSEESQALNSPEHHGLVGTDELGTLQKVSIMSMLAAGKKWWTG